MPKPFILITITLFLFFVNSAVSAGLCRSRHNGLCKKETHCSTGHVVSGICPGPREIKCCVPPSPSSSSPSSSSSSSSSPSSSSPSSLGREDAVRNPRCARENGVCMDVDDCDSGRTKAGLCPGSSEIRCCVGGGVVQGGRGNKRVVEVQGDELVPADEREVDVASVIKNVPVPVPDARDADGLVIGGSNKCSGATCKAHRTSLQVSVGQRAVDYFRKNLMEPILRSKKIMGEEADFFKDMEDSERIKKIKFGVRARLDRCYLENLELDEHQTDIDFVSAGNLIDIDLRGIKLVVRLEMGMDGVFSNKFKPRVLEVEITKAHFKAMFQVGWKKERPSIVSVTKPNLELRRENFDIRFLKGEKEEKGWFINFIIDLLEGIIARKIREKVASEFNKNVNPKMEKALSELPVQHTVKPIEALERSKAFMVDTRLATAPIITENGLHLLHRGEAYAPGGTCAGCPLPKMAMTDPSHFVHIRLGEHLPCCVLNTIHKFGALYHEGVIPAPRDKGETDKVKIAVAELVKAVWNVFEIKYFIRLPEAPVIRFKAGGEVRLFARANAEVHLVKKSAPNVVNEKTELVSAQIKIGAQANVALEGNVINYSLGGIQSEIERFEIKNTAINDKVRAPLNTFVNWVIEKELMPKVAAALKEKGGFEIPMVKGIKFVNPKLEIHEGFIDIGTDATYKIPEAGMFEK